MKRKLAALLKIKSDKNLLIALFFVSICKSPRSIPLILFLRILTRLNIFRAVVCSMNHHDFFIPFSLSLSRSHHSRLFKFLSDFAVYITLSTWDFTLEIKFSLDVINDFITCFLKLLYFCDIFLSVIVHALFLLARIKKVWSPLWLIVIDSLWNSIRCQVANVFRCKWERMRVEVLIYVNGAIVTC